MAIRIYMLIWDAISSKAKLAESCASHWMYGRLMSTIDNKLNTGTAYRIAGIESKHQSEDLSLGRVIQLQNG